MSRDQWLRVDEYLSKVLIAPDRALDAALENSANAGLRAINVAPNQGKFLHLLARIRGATRILELGTLGGYSTIWLARALPPGGTLTSLEIDDASARVARANVEAAGLSDKVSIVVGKAADTLARLIDEAAEPFDFIFMDADKASYPTYLELVRKLSRPGTVIVGDNIVRRGHVTDPDGNDPDVAGVRAFLNLLANDPAFDTTAIQTVGEKGWDGFSLTIVSAQN